MERKSTRGILLSLFLTVFVDMVGIGIVIPVFPMLFADPHAGIFAMNVPIGHRFLIYGFLAACYPLAQFFGAPLLGALADRHGRKPILTLSLCGTFAGYVLFAWSVVQGNLSLMFFSRAMAGFMGGNIAIAFSSIADISDEKNKTKNFGLIGMAFGLGFILGPFIGGKLTDTTIYHGFNYSTPFIGASILAALNLFIVSFIYKETLKTKIHTEISFVTGFRNVGRAFTLSNLRTTFITMFLLTFGFTFFTQFFQVFLADKFQFTPSQVGSVFAFVGIWIAITQGGLVRIFAKWFTPKQIINISTIFLGIVFILLVLPDQKWILYFIIPFIAIFQGLISPNSMTIISQQAGPEAQGEILGINQSVQALAQAIPPVIAGYIVSIKIELPIIVASGCTILAGIIFLTFFKNRIQPEFREE
ncbi:MAG TPA: MFS transporter [Bacteroidia bacterium]|nr:MFS transporter [Bacteroidia bacterium]